VTRPGGTGWVSLVQHNTKSLVSEKLPTCDLKQKQISENMPGWLLGWLAAWLPGWLAGQLCFVGLDSFGKTGHKPVSSNRR
jgi:hypothetical protein